MKKIIMSLCLLMVISSPSFAGYKEKNIKTVRSSWNPITIYNETNVDVAYVMLGTYGGGVYGITRGHSDIYHSGKGDQYAAFQVGICHEVGTDIFSTCKSFENVNPCPSAHYNADFIKEIHIQSLTSCKITCLDGSATSCRVG